jgi:hypothetical protein
MASDGLRVDNRTRHPRWNFAPTPSIRRCPQCWASGVSETRGRRPPCGRPRLRPWCSSQRVAARQCSPGSASCGRFTATSSASSIRTAKARTGESGNGTNSLFPVSSLQQLVCSFEGTEILIRPVRSPVQFSNDRGRRGHFRKQAILSPAGRWILPGGPFAPVLIRIGGR